MPVKLMIRFQIYVGTEIAVENNQLKFEDNSQVNKLQLRWVRMFYF